MTVEIHSASQYCPGSIPLVSFRLAGCIIWGGAGERGEHPAGHFILNLLNFIIMLGALVELTAYRDG